MTRHKMHRRGRPFWVVSLGSCALFGILLQTGMRYKNLSRTLLTCPLYYYLPLSSRNLLPYSALTKMQFINLLVLFAPALAQATIWNLSGTCSSSLTCDIDQKYTDPVNVEVCGNGNGHFAGSGKGGRLSCTPPNTKCTYVWQC
jgi:hypothetical protein